MSWLSGIANKAEELLNRVDQTAAVALNQDEEEKRSSTQRGYSNNTGQLRPSQSSLSSSASVPSNLNIYDTSLAGRTQANLKQTSPSSSTLKTSGYNNKSKKDNDEELFEFLNSDTKLENGKSDGHLSVGHSRQSSISSNVSSKSAKAALERHTYMNDVNSSSASTPEDEESPISILTHTASSVSIPMPDETNGQNSSSVSALELENRLLRSEISSLNQEMSSMLKRAKSAEQELQRTHNQLSNHGNQLSQSDQMLRELQSRENDLTEALHAKDSQLGVLRVRYEEMEKQLEAKNQTVSSLQHDKDRILQDHTDSSGLQSHALDSLKAKLRETDAALQREREIFKQSQQETIERQARHQQEQQMMAESLTKSQKRGNDEKSKLSDLSNQLKNTRQNYDSMRKELADYKEKAARILQSKDKLIATLKDGTNNAVGASGPETSISTIELEQVCQEKDMYREELQQTRLITEQLRAEVLDLEVQMATENESSQNDLQNLEEQFSLEKRKREDAEQEILKQKQELRYAHEEQLRQKTDVQARLNERDLEVEKLRNQLTAKQNNTGQVELEGRLHALTESLIHKQTMLEALSTEKNSLGLQLERLERQYRDMQLSTSRAAATTINVNETDEIRHRLPGFMRESPMDTKVTRGMKKAANTLDRFSVRLGVFLRRYPMARIFVICYMMTLHVWVSVVLLTYQPEIHGHDFQPKPPVPGAPGIGK